MAMDPEEFKKKMMELDFLYEEAMDDNAAMDRVYDRIMKSATEIAMATYPELKNMESHQIKWFGDKLSYHVTNIVQDLDRLSCWVESPEDFDAEGNSLPRK